MTTNLLSLQLVLTALNSSKSAYASFSVEKNIFFEKYHLNNLQARSQQSRDDNEAHFTCQLYNKVLLTPQSYEAPFH